MEDEKTLDESYFYENPVEQVVAHYTNPVSGDNKSVRFFCHLPSGEIWFEILVNGKTHPAGGLRNLQFAINEYNLIEV